METKFINAVANAVNLPVEEIRNLSHNEIVHNIILEKILRPGGQDTRGWRVPDLFMYLMAEFGEYMYRAESFSGSVMLKIALQRISCGAVVHEPTPIDLPKGYKKYSVKYDQAGLMSDDCWQFLIKQAETCFKVKSSNRHITKIIFGLLDNLDSDGQQLNGYMFEYSYLNVSAKDAFNWAWKTALESIPFETMYDHLAHPQRWFRFRKWFKTNWDMIDHKDFFQRIEAKGFFNKRKVKKAILN